MITRPAGLAFKKVDLYFKFRHYSTLEIDLNHINRGRSGTREAGFTIEEVARRVVNLIDGQELEFTDEKRYGDEFCYYFTQIGYYKGKKYKLVFCICTDRPNTIGILTLFRV